MKIRVLLALASVGVLGACGGGDYCARVSPCPNDVPSTQAQITQCRATFTANQNAACYGDYVAYLNCAADNTVCGGNGTTDANLTATKATNNCLNQRANVLSCCTKNPNSTVCN